MPTEVQFGQISSPNDLNQLVDILQRRAGQVETGKYFVAGLSTAGSQTISNYIPSRSRDATPVSVTFDTTDAAPSGTLNAPNTGHLSAGGFQMFAISNAANGNNLWGGNFNINF
jgi:hypothetical protein